MTQIKSDGGSSAYYEIYLPEWRVETLHHEDGSSSCRIEVKDVIKYSMDNDFDRGNIFKALFRLGKKEGSDTIYDLRKCEFFIQEMIKDYEESL